MISRRSFLAAAAAGSCGLFGGARGAPAINAPGVSDTEIRIGQTMPYSGPQSPFGVIGRAEAAYFRMINEKGGVSGRKIGLISLDDSYIPARTIEQTRRLVEEEGVAFIFGSFGDPTNLAARQYLNDARIPQLLLAALAETVVDPERYPWTTTLHNSASSEARVYAKYIAATKPDAKIGVLYEKSSAYRMLGTWIRQGLGDGAGPAIVSEAPCQASDPTVDSQIIDLQASGADTLIIGASPKAAAKAIRKAYDIGWTPDRYIGNSASSIVAVMKPAGVEKAKGVVSAAYLKDPTDPRWKDDPGIREWQAFAAKYLSPADVTDQYAFYGCHVAMVLTHVLTQCGGDLSRDNILRQALSIRDFATPMLLPGISVNTSPTDYVPIRQFQLERFNGENWELFGGVLGG